MYTGTGLPANYRGGAFVGEHGSWDRTPLNGYKVVFVPFSGGQPSGPAQDVVTGFLDANDHARGKAGWPGSRSDRRIADRRRRWGHRLAGVIE